MHQLTWTWLAWAKPPIAATCLPHRLRTAVLANSEPVWWPPADESALLQGVENSIPADIELAYIPYLHGGIFPGLFLYTNAARLMRPVRQIPHGRKKGSSGAAGAVELLGTLEQNNMAIR